MSELDRKARQLLGSHGPLGKKGNLDRATLNVLHLLLRERSVTRTAMMVGQSQPAVSETLARLRTLIGDQLLVRSGSGMELTEHGRSLQEHVERALTELDWIVGKKPAFEPAGTTRTFRLATADNLDVRFHVNLLARLRRDAPNALLEAFSLSRDFDYARELAEGKVDIVIANWPNPSSHLRLKPLLETEIVCIVGRKNRFASGALTWQRYREMAHIDITPRALGEVSPVDVNLVRLSVRREIVAHYPFFSLIPPIVAATDLVFTGGRLFLEGFRHLDDLVLRSLPEPLAPIQFYQLWHERSHHDEDCAWFRRTVAEVAANLHQRGDATP